MKFSGDEWNAKVSERPESAVGEPCGSTGRWAIDMTLDVWLLGSPKMDTMICMLENQIVRRCNSARRRGGLRTKSRCPNKLP